MNGWQCIVAMIAVDNAIKPYPLNYFEQVAIRAVNEALDAGLETIEERDQSVMTALVAKAMEYEELLCHALKVARRKLPMGLVPATEQAGLIAEAVHGAIEQRYLPYIFADRKIRKFHDILWPEIMRRLSEKLNCYFEPTDERRFVKWLMEFEFKKINRKKSKPSKATTRSK